MLFPQIPKRFLHGIGAEIGFNFGLLSGKISGKDEPLSDRYAKVAAIEKYLSSLDDVSDFEEKKWYRGIFQARIGGLSDVPGLFLVCSRMLKQTRILAGSAINLISSNEIDGKHIGYSFMPRMLNSLQTFVKLGYDDYDAELETRGMPTDYIFGGKVHGAMFHSLWELPDNETIGPLVDVEVFARIFLRQKIQSGQEIIIGSPLYIADAA